MNSVFQFILCAVCDQLARGSRDFALSPDDLQRIRDRLRSFWFFRVCPFIARTSITAVLFFCDVRCLFSDLRLFFSSIRLPKPVLRLALVFRWLRSFVFEAFVILGSAGLFVWLWSLLWI